DPSPSLGSVRRRVQRVRLGDAGPAAIMRRGKPPWHIVDPAPAPGRDPAPMAMAIGRPISWKRRRKPHRAVAFDGFPAAVAVERLITGHFGGEMAQRRLIACRRISGRGPPPCDKFIARRAI